MQIVDALAELVVLGLLPMESCLGIFKWERFMMRESNVRTMTIGHVWGATMAAVERLTTEKTLMLLWSSCSPDANPDRHVSLTCTCLVKPALAYAILMVPEFS